jgi:chemotaxis protein CheX
MNQKTIPIDVRDFLNKHSAEVFDTMLSHKTEPVANGRLPEFPERVIGSVGFGGENINGALYLHLSAEFANQIASGMLGLPAGEAPGEPEVNDVIGELTNMLAGGLKSSFCDAGAPCAVSTPAIIRGTSFQIETMPDVHHEILLFDCGTSRFAVEVHIKID